MQLKTFGTEAISRLRGVANAIKDEVTGQDDAPLVGDVASAPLSWVGPKATLSEVVEELVEDDVGIVAVLDDQRVVGLVSERDIIDAISDGAELDTVWAADVMATDIVWVDPEDPLTAAAHRMRDLHLRHLLVNEGEGGEPAAVSIRDVLAGLVTPEPA